MNQNFSHLLTMSFKHVYFGEGLFRSLDISFTEETMKLMRDLEIIIKPFSGGFHLLTSNPELLAINSDDYLLQLYITCSDPYYINYTVLPNYEPGSSLLYFNNLNVNTVDNNNALQLHNEAFVAEQDVLRLTHGKFRIDSYDPGVTYTFRQATDSIIPNQFITKESPDSDNFIISNLPQGIVRVFDGDELVDALYYFPEAVWKKPVGSIEIFTRALSDLIKNDTKVNYSMRFDNRKTIWKYFLMSKEYKKFNNLTIINSAGEQIFELENGENESLVFTSRYKLPLSEQASESFQLVDNFVSSERSEIVVIKYLANPSPDQVYFDNQKSDKTMYSHIYL